jgi:replicative DNA helicase
VAVHEVEQAGHVRALYRPAGEVVAQAVEELHLRNAFSDLGGLRTGIDVLDKRIREVLVPGRIVIVAGESGRGKTALVGQLAVAFASQAPTLLVNLEDDSVDSAKRWIASVSRENVSKIRSGFSGQVGIPHSIAEAATHIGGLGMDVIDNAPLTVEGIARQAYLWKKERKIEFGGALLIDQLSHIVATDPSSRKYFLDRGLPTPPPPSARADKVPEWQVWFLSEVAKRLQITIILAHQLNNLHAIDTKPTLRSVRDSQGIAHKADLVLIPWRPRKEPNAFAGPGQPATVDAPETKAFLLGVKARQIPEFEEEVEWLGAQQRFADVGTAHTVYSPPPNITETAKEGARRLAELRAKWDRTKPTASLPAPPQLQLDGGKDND